MKPTMLARLEAIERKRGAGTLIYTHEAPDGNGGLILLSDRASWGQGNPVEVGRVARHQVRQHRQAVVRIERSYGHNDAPTIADTPRPPEPTPHTHQATQSIQPLTTADCTPPVQDTQRGTNTIAVTGSKSNFLEAFERQMQQMGTHKPPPFLTGTITGSKG